MLAKLVCVVSSALLFTLSFYLPDYCAWFLFIYLVPLFYAAVRLHLRSSDGFLWGVAVFGTRLHPITLVIYERGAGDYRMVAAFFLIVFCACHAALWFWGAELLVKKICGSDYCVVGVWALTGLIFFMVVQHAIFWVLSPVQGYPFMLPLLPLAEDYRWLMLLPMLGVDLLLAALIMVSAGITFLILGNKRGWFLVIIGMLPFMCGWLKNTTEVIPVHALTIGYVSPVKKELPIDMGAAIATKLHAYARSEKFSVLVMPESAFPYSLNEFDRVLSCWATALQGVPLLLGAHRKTEQLLNTLYFLSGSRIINYYDKKLPVPFAETIPKSFDYGWLRTLFLRDGTEFCPGSCALHCECIQLTKDLIVQPLICSELFFGVLPQCPEHPGIPCIAIVNESWFSSRAHQTHMVYVATLQAMRARRDILYVSHVFAIWITADGMRYPLGSL